MRLAGTLKRFSTWCATERHLSSDLLSTLPSPRAVRRPLPRVIPLQLVIRLLEAPDTADPIGLRDRAILETFYASAMAESVSTPAISRKRT